MKLAIVGAGFTASMLTFFLKDENVDISVFEKSRGCGGRAGTKQTDWGQFDMGATVIPAKGADFCEFMQQLVKQNIAAQWPTQVHNAQLNDCNEFTTELQQTNRSYFVFNKKMNHPCREWMSNARLHFASLVTEVRHVPEQGWQLKIGDTWDANIFDNIVLTAPWPQTKDLLEVSHLPIEPINFKQSWTSCWSVGIQLALDLPSRLDLIYQKKLPVQTLVRDSAKPFRAGLALDGQNKHTEIWVAQLSHNMSEKLGITGRREAINMASDNLSAVLNIRPNVIQATYAHYWRYSRPVAGQLPLGIIANSQHGLFAGGDWSFGVSLEAAYEAARALKKAIISG